MLREMHCNYFDKITSTSDWLKEKAEVLPFEVLTIARAGEQTQGRGRLDRKWISYPEANLYMSCAFSLPKPLLLPYQLGSLVAISSVQTLDASAISVKLKWPNDLLSAGKKLGGILVEALALPGRCVYVLGIGLNINAQRDHLPLDRPATSLFLETGKYFSVEKVAAQLSQQILLDLNRYFSQGFSAFYGSFTEVMAYQPGDSIRFSRSGEIIEGSVFGYTADGALILNTLSGAQILFAGEVVESGFK